MSPADSTVVTEGVAIEFKGTGTDPEDGNLSGPSLVWVSSLDGQIGIGETFFRSDLSVGEHLITLTATDSKDGARADSATITILPAFLTISGRVLHVTPDGIAKTEGLKFFITHGNRTDSADVGADGRFSVEIENRDDIPVRICVDAPDPGNRAFHASCAEESLQNVLEVANNGKLSFALIPHTWNIKNGVYAGESVELDIEKPFEESSAQPWPTFYWGGKPRSIGAPPIPVALDRENSEIPFTDADSVFIFDVISRLHDYLGMGEVFRPATMNEITGRVGVQVTTITSGPSTGGARFSQEDNTMITGGEIRLRVHMTPSGQMAFVPNENLLNELLRGVGGPAGVATPEEEAEQNYFISEFSIMHEFVHVMGTFHTCSWPTVMFTQCTAEIWSRVPTKWDAAYLQMTYAVLNLERSGEALYGIFAARDGQNNPPAR